MKVLIVPMAAMAETAGSFSRAITLAKALQKQNIECALCAARDINYKSVEGLPTFELPVPMPLGLPACIATHTFPVAHKLGITNRKTVHSFEEVLFLTGNTDYKYLRLSVQAIRTAIRSYNPEVIYSEFSISAIIAARQENRRLYITASKPTQSDYASSPQYATGVNRLLYEFGLPTVHSTLDLFSWADMKFVPSIEKLEHILDENVVFCGAWKGKPNAQINGLRKNILVYMGNTISPVAEVREIKDAFKHIDYNVYVAGMGLQEQTIGNVRVTPRFDFQMLLPETALFINHGGQNSIIDGLVHGVPQLVFPGKVFERKYNAASLARCGAGINMPYGSFKAAQIAQAASEIFLEPSYGLNARSLGEELVELGGAGTVAQYIIDSLGLQY